MTIEEATVIFVKHHDQWSNAERAEFVRALEVKDMRVPHNLDLATSPRYFDLCSEEVLGWILERVKGVP